MKLNHPLTRSPFLTARLRSLSNIAQPHPRSQINFTLDFGISSSAQQWPGLNSKEKNRGNNVIAYYNTGLKETPSSLKYIEHSDIWAQCSYYARLLQECIGSKAIEKGVQVHSWIIKTGFQSDVFVGNNLLNMYAKCGILTDARKVFDEMPKRDVVSWNAMLAGYAQSEQCRESLVFFWKMQWAGMKPNRLTFASIFKACSSLGFDQGAEQVHAYTAKSGFESDVFVRSNLVDIYAKCGSIEDARRMFDEMPERDVVLWNVMIAGYTQVGYFAEALKIFEQMEYKPDRFTFLSVLRTSAFGLTAEQVKQDMLRRGTAKLPWDCLFERNREGWKWIRSPLLLFSALSPHRRTQSMANRSILCSSSSDLNQMFQ